MLKTRLTDRFDLQHPVISAPMAFAAGGKLAGAVSDAGGLGLIGGGYGDSDWLSEQFDAAGNRPVGCGLITWSLAQAPHLLDQVIARSPKAVFLSFADPAPFAPTIIDAGIPLICQVQNIRDATRALEVGAEVIVAQGSEAGGHTDTRATMTLVPEIADLIARQKPDTLLCAAGGIGDGRGLAAALSLGADGVLVGTRFWASEEALVHPNMLQAAMAAGGDDTMRSSVVDWARDKHWPDQYQLRALKNSYVEEWDDRKSDYFAAQADEKARYAVAASAGDTAIAPAIGGEALGLIHTIEPAGEILTQLVREAEACLKLSAGLIVPA